MQQNSPFVTQFYKNFLGRGTAPSPSPHPTPLGTFGALILAPSALDFGAALCPPLPQLQILDPPLLTFIIKTVKYIYIVVCLAKEEACLFNP